MDKPHRSKRHMTARETALIYMALEKVLIKRDDGTCQFREGYDDTSIYTALLPEIDGLERHHIYGVRLQEWGRLHFTPKPKAEETKISVDAKLAELKYEIASLENMIRNTNKTVGDLRHEVSVLKEALASKANGSKPQNELPF